jgi:hypothetical protein
MTRNGMKLRATLILFAVLLALTGCATRQSAAPPETRPAARLELEFQRPNGHRIEIQLRKKRVHYSSVTAARAAKVLEYQPTPEAWGKFWSALSSSGWEGGHMTHSTALVPGYQWKVDVRSHDGVAQVFGGGNHFHITRGKAGPTRDARHWNQFAHAFELLLGREIDSLRLDPESYAAECRSAVPLR